MRFTFERTVLTMMSAKFIMVGVMMSLVIFLILQNEAQQQQLQIRANQTGTKLINIIFSKLDSLNNHTNYLISAQGNISNGQRQAIIKEFEDIGSGGGIAQRNDQIKNQHLLHEILNNLTEINNKTTR